MQSRPALARALLVLVVGSTLALGACDVPGGGAPPVGGLRAAPDPLVLSTTSGGPSVSGTVTVTNTSLTSVGPLSVVAKAGFHPSTDGCTGVTLAAGHSCALEFTYTAVSGLEDRDASVLVTAPTGLTTFRIRERTAAAH